MNNFLDPGKNHCILKDFADSAAPDAASAPRSKTKPKKTRSVPVCVRFTDDERKILTQRAGKQSLSAYLRECALGENVQVRKARGMTPVKDHVVLAKVLSALGRSNLARDLDALAWSVEDGVLHLSAQDQRIFRDACVSVILIRRDVMKALGLKE